jgi:hypothetical protein
MNDGPLCRIGGQEQSLEGGAFNASRFEQEKRTVVSEASR